MSLFGWLDAARGAGKKKRRENAGSDKKLDLPGLDDEGLLEDLHGGHLVLPESPTGGMRFFGKYTDGEVRELMDWSGIFQEIMRKGYEDLAVELQFLSDLDQRILIRAGSETLFHLRLKLAPFRFRLQPGAPSRKLLYIDWLMTRHPRSARVRPERLFPGQTMPGLGIFPEVSDFVFNLAMGIGAQGAFNIPEYFHDALLFHRQFRFYDPAREAFFRGLIRDLRRFGARQISMALAEGGVRDQDGREVRWVPGEMIHLLDPEFADAIWNREYFTKVVRQLKRLHFKMA